MLMLRSQLSGTTSAHHHQLLQKKGTGCLAPPGCREWTLFHTQGGTARTRVDGQGAGFKVWGYLLLKPCSFPFIPFLSFKLGKICSLQPTCITLKMMLWGISNGNWKTRIWWPLSKSPWGATFGVISSLQLHHTNCTYVFQANKPLPFISCSSAPVAQRQCFLGQWRWLQSCSELSPTNYIYLPTGHPQHLALEEL